MANELWPNIGISAYERWFEIVIPAWGKIPRPSLASSGYCLAHTGPRDAEYVVHLPAGGEISVDLSAVKGEMEAEWIDAGTGASRKANRATGGQTRQFTAPFSGDAVLHLKAAETVNQ